MVEKQRADVLSIPSSQQLRDEILKQKYVWQEHVSGRAAWVVDIDSLQTSLRKRFGDGGGRDEEKTGALIESLGRAFPEPMITKDELGTEALARTLFYFPASAEHATRTVAIKGARFHLRIPDVLQKMRMRTEHATQDESEISTLETQVALLIFHPRYGDGFRDEEGTLYVRNKDSREYAPFSGTFLEEWGISKNYFIFPAGVTAHKSNTPQGRSLREGFSAELPHLVRKGLLRPVQDVKQSTLGGAHVDGRVKERAGVSSSGSRMINGVLHYIGKGPEFQGKAIRVIAVTPTLGCVVDESVTPPRVSHLFNVLSKETVPANAKGWHLANAKLTNTRPFSTETLGLKKFPEETALRFQERKEAVDRGVAYLMLNILPKCPQAAVLFRGGTVEIAEIGRAAYWLDQEKKREQLDAFVEKFGINGLRTFLAASIEPTAGDMILALAQTNSVDTMRLVFERFATFADRVNSLGEYLLEKFGHTHDDIVHAATERLIRRGYELLNRAHSHKDDPATLDQLLMSLDTETRIFGDLARLYIDRGYRLQDIVGLETRVLSGGTLKGTTRQALTDMHRAGYQRGGDYSEQQIANLERGLQQAFDQPSSEFRIVADASTGKELAALRFDYILGQGGKISSIYLASVMSNGNLEGSKVGLLHVAAQLRAQAEAHDAPITAIASPRTAITSKYLEMGFVVVGVTESSDSKAFFRLEMRKDRSRSYKTVGRATEKAIISAAEHGAASPNNSIIHAPAASEKEHILRLGALQKEDARWCITRWFRDPQASKGAARYFAVFERPVS